MNALKVLTLAACMGTRTAGPGPAAVSGYIHDNFEMKLTEKY